MQPSIIGEAFEALKSSSAIDLLYSLVFIQLQISPHHAMLTRTTISHPCAFPPSFPLAIGMSAMRIGKSWDLQAEGSGSTIEIRCQGRERHLKPDSDLGTHRKSP